MFWVLLCSTLPLAVYALWNLHSFSDLAKLLDVTELVLVRIAGVDVALIQEKLHLFMSHRWTAEELHENEGKKM